MSGAVYKRTWTTRKGATRSHWRADYYDGDGFRHRYAFPTKKAARQWLAEREGNVKPFLVWSEQHGAWWRPGAIGYTRSIREAGRYSLEEAADICEQANRYLEKRHGNFNKVAVFDPMLTPDALSRWGKPDK